MNLILFAEDSMSPNDRFVLVALAVAFLFCVALYWALRYLLKPDPLTEMIVARQAAQIAEDRQTIERLYKKYNPAFCDPQPPNTEDAAAVLEAYGRLGDMERFDLTGHAHMWVRNLIEDQA